MEIVCRLCAVTIEPHKTRHNMNGNIERMLIRICDWNSYRYHINLPKTVCHSCCLRLEQCWNFQISVTKAQKELYKKVLSFELPKSKVIDEGTFDDSEVDELMELNEIAENSVSSTSAECNNNEMIAEIDQTEVQPDEETSGDGEADELMELNDIAEHSELHIKGKAYCSFD